MFDRQCQAHFKFNKVESNGVGFKLQENDLYDTLIVRRYKVADQSPIYLYEGTRLQKKAYLEVNQNLIYIYSLIMEYFDNQFGDELSFTNSVDDLLYYLNDKDEDEEPSLLEIDYEEENNDKEHQILLREIRRRMSGLSPTNFGDDYYSIEKEKMVTDAIKAIKIINEKIIEFNLVKDTNGIWKQL